MKNNLNLLQRMGRTYSEMSPLNDNEISNGSRSIAGSSSSYGSILPSYLEYFRNSLKRSKSMQTLNRVGDSMGSHAYRALLNYIEINDLPGLKTFLDTRHLPVDDRDEDGTTVLMVAAGRGLLPFVREFIARGADIQADDLDNWSSLLFAARNGHTDVVKILVEHGANIEHHDMGGWTALMWAAYRGHTDIVAFLLEKGADIFAHGNYHLGSLLWAAGRGHKEIVQMLVQRGAKVNVGDKYGTTALVWACRKGNAEIVEILLKAGANVDTAGMYSWTALLVAVSGGHHECVNLILERKPNVNALDKDGMTALTIACREGLHEIASALIAAGAYVNIQDRAGDTPLIHAVKNGHRSVVEALLKRHVDIDIQGKDKKTALYTAVEKNHIGIARFLLSSNPDLELATKDGDTPLLKAVRSRHLDIVQMLVERRAKVGAMDRRGDTALHIAMRARSKAIVEVLLRNPKNSQLLYRANKAGETPYALDTSHQKTILGQVFGARRLNTNEDSEGMLGYELFSSALADVLSEPTLTTPITVGLYAKWGSGKSFLLAKLRDEMISFARQWAHPPVKAPWLSVIICWHFALLTGTCIGLTSESFIWGISTAAGIFMFLCILLIALKIASDRYDVNWTYSLYSNLMKRLGRLRLIFQVAFCHPPGSQSSSQAMPVRFHFAEANSASPTGESSVGHMIVALYEAIENYYGSLPTRLYRAFRPKPLKSTSTWRWRRMCCVPIVLLFELGFVGLLTITSLLFAYLRAGSKADDEAKQKMKFTMYILGAILFAGVLANLHAWLRAFKSLFLSQGRHLRSAIKSNEGAPLTALGAEVSLMTDMVKCLDAFTKQQSRLVGIVDALDTCDTERILTVLSAVQTLLSSPNKPFVLLLAVDPHVIAKAAEANSRRLFTEGGIGGHDFLRNLVHLPVYLQNSGLRKVQRAQNTAMLFRRNTGEIQSDEPTLGHSVSARRLSNASEIMSSNEKLRPGQSSLNPNRAGSKKLRLSESIASSIGSNLHRVGQNPTGAIDLSKMILTDDYFSDVNPRSMRRLMNVIYITVRLLKAFQIDFSWYRLSSWINLTEQWPSRASMIVLQHDQSGENLDDSVSLQTLYDKVRVKLPCLREAAPLLDLDRDERKLEAFLQLHKHDLLVADLRIFLPFTINLDPYLRKVLKEDQQAMEDEGLVIPINKPIPKYQPSPPQYFNSPQLNSYPPPQMQPYNFYVPPQRQSDVNSMMNNYASSNNSASDYPVRKKSVCDTNLLDKLNIPPDILNTFSEDLLQIRLSQLSVDDIIGLLKHVDDLRQTLDKLGPILHQNSINGRVLMHCDLSELKSVLNLTFGHWELFRLLVTSLRQIEQHQPLNRPNLDVPIDELNQQSSIPNIQRQKTVMEKQVTLEEQMICGALQTLNEEAFEDVIGSERPSPTPGQQADYNDFSNYLPSSISACPSTANSPVLARRDSILKHSHNYSSYGANPLNTSNSTPSVSTMTGQPAVKMEKRVSIKSDAPILLEYISEKRSKSARPASLILTKGDRPTFKLVRSPSVNSDDMIMDEKVEISVSDDTKLLNSGSGDDESVPLVQVNSIGSS